ncbi:glycosyltransferase [Leifsonia sp. AG29]|uniref:glycosyltransferase n=1 Tax=Leifsonia sp. AG29 TaxID=2598860 RepID=UPI00131D3E7C|nr:glycosyltransferase [Leifsonia sp. AG29]
MATRVGVFAPLFPPATRGGGPIRTLEALVKAAPDSAVISILTRDRDLGEVDPLPVPSNRWRIWDRARVFNVTADSPRLLARGYRALKATRPQVLYFNSFFEPRFSILPQLLWRFGYWGGATRLLAPRGEFGAGALGQKPARKRAFIVLYRALGLHRRLFWHASSEMEAADIRRVWGRDAKILIRENETLLPDRAAEVPELHGAPGPLRAFFIGRIARLKGLHVALEALRAVQAPVDFDVFGPIEDRAYYDECLTLASQLPDNVRVAFRGPLAREVIHDTLSGYELFLFPSAGENFGHVIAESLSAACAVFCSDRTPWSDVLRAGGGAVVPLNASDWSRAIQRRATESPDERRSARIAAGQAYDRWRAEARGPHVFELLWHEQRELLPAD